MISKIIKNFMMSKGMKRIKGEWIKTPHFCIVNDDKYKEIYIGWFKLEIKYF